MIAAISSVAADVREQLSRYRLPGVFQCRRGFFQTASSFDTHRASSTYCGPWRKVPSIYGETTTRKPESRPAHKCQYAGGLRT